MEPTALLVPAGVIRQLSKIEEEIDEEIKEEIKGENVKRKSTLSKFRQEGANRSHSKKILLLVVVLNCVDCVLVLSELLLDVYFIDKEINQAVNTMEKFNQILLDRYPDHFEGLDVHDTHAFYNTILHTRVQNVRCNETQGYLTVNATETGTLVGSTREPNILLDVVKKKKKKRLFGPHHNPGFLDVESVSLEEKISHVFHKLSIVILGILVLYTLFKVFCQGVRFFKHKLEVFDALIVIASFTLDLFFIEGLTNYRAESFVLILVIMVPWRIIRVLNSLMIAVKDNFHFMLKIMYKKNKVSTARIQQLDKQNALKESCISSLVQLCTTRGVHIAEINAILDRTVADTAAKKLSQRMMLGACFGFYRQESADGETDVEMAPLTNGGT